MDDKIFDLMMVRALKGAPLSCYIFLKMENRPLTSGDLVEGTGYSPRKVAQAMMLLQEYELVKIDQEKKWQLAERANFLNE